MIFRNGEKVARHVAIAEADFRFHARRLRSDAVPDTGTEGHHFADLADGYDEAAVECARLLGVDREWSGSTPPISEIVDALRTTEYVLGRMGHPDAARHAGILRRYQEGRLRREGGPLEDDNASVDDRGVAEAHVR